MGRRLGFLVGINACQDPTFRPLQYAESDAKAFAQWLVDARGGNWNSADVLVVTGSDSTKERLETQLMQLCIRTAEPGDLILIYFAGHAFVDEADGQGYLAGFNSSYRQPASAVSLAGLVRQAIAASRASQAILMLDCFQTGTPWNRLRSSPYDFQPLIGPALQKGLQQSKGRLVYCLCRGNDIAPEVGEKGLGMGLYRAIVGLSGPAKDPLTGQITLQQLYSYASNKPGAQYQPQIFGQESRPVVLVGDMPALAPAASSGQNAPAVSAYSTVKAPTGQVTFQGVGESGPLVGLSSQGPRAATTEQLSPSNSTSGQLSLSLVEQNRQQQCIKLMQQAMHSLQAQNIPEALALMDQVLQMNPGSIDALTLKGQVLGSIGRFQEALATIEQLLQVDPNNALAWSMRAALLANTGNPREALASIDRSLALNPQNPEARAIQESIQAGLRGMPGSGWQPGGAALTRTPIRDSAKSFLLSAALQVLALILGSAGAAILVFQPHLPIIIGFLLESSGLALLCIIAARGAFLYGLGRLLFTILLCLISAGLLGGIYKFGYNRLINVVVGSPALIVPVIFLAFWFVAAAIAPLLSGLGGFIGGLVVGVRRKRF